MNLIKLKIKVKHLAVEPAIIRKEERKLSGLAKYDLQFHRKWDVRNEARATQLAIAFLKNKNYKTIEPKLKDKNDYRHSIVKKSLLRMLNKYGPSSYTDKDISTWTEGSL